jgi:hypothetical protein
MLHLSLDFSGSSAEPGKPKSKEKEAKVLIMDLLNIYTTSNPDGTDNYYSTLLPILTLPNAFSNASISIPAHNGS